MLTPYISIPLTNSNEVAIIDFADFPLVSRYRWTNKNGYAVAYQKGKPIYMHRLINDTPDDMATDHINNNGLDNRRNNLRSATTQQNLFNSGARLSINGKRTTTQYKGVDRRRRKEGGRYRVRISTPDGRKSLGHTWTEIEGAMLYDRAALHYHGEFAKLNFPELREQYLIQNQKEGAPQPSCKPLQKI